MKIKIAREVAARIWCDAEMSSVEMDVELAEEIAQLLAKRMTVPHNPIPRWALGEAALVIGLCLLLAGSLAWVLWGGW